MKTNSFAQLLGRLIDSHFAGSSKDLATKAGVDPALVSRVLHGKRNPTPTFVGRVARVANRKQAAQLIQAYLQEVAAEVAEQQLAAGSKQSRGIPRSIVVEVG